MQFAQLFSKRNRFTMSLIHVYLDIKSIILKQNGNDKKISYGIGVFHKHSAHTRKACSPEILQRGHKNQEVARPEPLTMVPQRATSCFCFTLRCDTHASRFRW